MEKLTQEQRDNRPDCIESIDLHPFIAGCCKCGEKWIYGEPGPGDPDFIRLIAPHRSARAIGFQNKTEGEVNDPNHHAVVFHCDCGEPFAVVTQRITKDNWDWQLYEYRTD